MKSMDKPDNEISSKQKEFVEFLEKTSKKDSVYQKDYFKKETSEVFHLNFLITKNISLFTKNPNYKLFTWLMVQLFIFSLFVLVATFMKNNLAPYINSL